MARKAKKADLFDILDPLRGYAEMMSVDDVAEFAGLGKTSAATWIQHNGGIKMQLGGTGQRYTWRIHKEYVRRAFNLPRASA